MATPTKKAGLGRFASLLSESVCSRPIYDQILFETHGCVITPTLGSILPNWLLVIPRYPLISFAHWRITQKFEPTDLVKEVLTVCNVGAERAIWFEHGPSKAGSLIGCGVDQSHLHILIDPPFSFREFMDQASRMGQLSWIVGSAEIAYQSVNPEQSYFIAGSGNLAIMSQGVESVGSQFFRRVVASLTSQPDVWNYRIHPHLHNVKRTIRTISRVIA